MRDKTPERFGIKLADVPHTNDEQESGMAARNYGKTLEQFSDEIDGHLGAAHHFGDTVAELHKVKTDIRRIEAMAQTAYAGLKHRFEKGDRAALVGGDRVELRMTKGCEGRKVTTVRSATVKRINPAAWKAAQISKPFVVVKYETDETFKPGPPTTRAAVESLIDRYRRHRARIVELGERQDRAVFRLREVAERCGWDGMAVAFTDGWQVGLNRLTFDADTLRELEPEVYASCEETTIRAVSPRLYIATVGGDELDEYDEHDGE